MLNSCQKKGGNKLNNLRFGIIVIFYMPQLLCVAKVLTFGKGSSENSGENNVLACVWLPLALARATNFTACQKK